VRIAFWLLLVIQIAMKSPMHLNKSVLWVSDCSKLLCCCCL